jgi:hypothetical protein
MSMFGGDTVIVKMDISDILKLQATLNEMLGLLKLTLEKENQIMATLEDIMEEISSQTTRIAGLNTLVDGIRTQLLAILEGTVIAPLVQAKIDALFTQLKAQGAAIDEVIVENTFDPELPVTP